MGFCFKYLYVFTKVGGGGGGLGCTYIYANKHLGTDGASECRKVWAIKEDAQRCGHKRREYIFPRRRWEKGEQAKEGAVLFSKQREAWSGQTVGTRRKERAK